MRPCSLQRAASWRIAQTLVSAVWYLDISEELHRKQLVRILWWLSEEESRSLSKPVLQGELHKALGERLRCKRNPSIYLTCLLALCPQVTVDQIKVSVNFETEPPENAGLVFSPEVCQHILEVLEEFLKHGSEQNTREEKKYDGKGDSAETKERNKRFVNGMECGFREAVIDDVISDRSLGRGFGQRRKDAVCERTDIKLDENKKKASKEETQEEGRDNRKDEARGTRKEGVRKCNEGEERSNTDNKAGRRGDERETIRKMDISEDSGTGTRDGDGRRDHEREEKRNMDSKEERGSEATQERYLCTKSLVLEMVFFCDQDFLTNLVRMMPDLHSICLQYNITPNVIRALSQHCLQLQSLCILEQHVEATIPEIDLIPLLFGTPLDLVTEDLLPRFHREGEEFRCLFVPQFPNLKVLSLEELYIRDDIMRIVYTLALLLQPKLECLGSFPSFTFKDLVTFRGAWNVLHGPNGLPAVLPLKYVNLNDDLCQLLTETDSHETVDLFDNLTSAELFLMTHNDNKILSNFINIFCCRKNLKALSLSNLPLQNISCLRYLEHLRLTQGITCSFDAIHLILDTCPDLCTLSVHHELYHPPDHPHQEMGQPPEMNLDEEDRRALDDLVLLAALDDLAAGLRQEGENEEGDEGVGEENIGGIMDLDARQPHNFPYPPPCPPSRKKTHAVHTKLTTLRIASLCKARHQATQTFLHSVLLRVTELQYLCLGPWLGSLVSLRPALTCTASAIVAVLSQAAVDGVPLLTHLKQLCCLPSTGLDSEKTCRSLVVLARVLPALECLTLPALDPVLLGPTLRHFRHSHIDLRNKCDTDRIFSSWDPEH